MNSMLCFCCGLSHLSFSEVFMATVASLIRERDAVAKAAFLAPEQKAVAFSQIDRQIAELLGQVSLPLDNGFPGAVQAPPGPQARKS